MPGGSGAGEERPAPGGSGTSEERPAPGGSGAGKEGPAPGGVWVQRRNQQLSAQVWRRDHRLAAQMRRRAHPLAAQGQMNSDQLVPEWARMLKQESGAPPSQARASELWLARGQERERRDRQLRWRCQTSGRLGNKSRNEKKEDPPVGRRLVTLLWGLLNNTVAWLSPSPCFSTGALTRLQWLLGGTPG